MYHNAIKKDNTLLALTAVAMLTFSACAEKGTEKSEKQSTDSKAMDVSYPTTAVHFINPTYELSVPGELKPYEQVAVYARVSGFVQRIYVDRGDYVRKGQLLALLEAPEMEQQYLSSKSAEQKVYNDFIYAKQAYERLMDAAKTSGAVADIEIDRAKTAMESAKAAFEVSRAGTAYSSQLKQYLRITAPFDGVISARNVSVGALVGASGHSPLFTIAEGKKLRLTLSLPEKHAASVQQNMPIEFTVSSQPGRIFEAVLARTSGLLDQHDRSLTLEFDVNNATGELQGGDYAQVKLKLKRQKPSFWVNSKSVLNTQSGTFVLALTNNEIKRIAINEGVRVDTLTEVFGDIDPAYAIILKPSEEIKEGKIK